MRRYHQILRMYLLNFYHSLSRDQNLVSLEQRRQNRNLHLKMLFTAVKCVHSKPMFSRCIKITCRNTNLKKIIHAPFVAKIIKLKPDSSFISRLIMNKMFFLMSASIVRSVLRVRLSWIITWKLIFLSKYPVTFVTKLSVPKLPWNDIFCQFIQMKTFPSKSFVFTVMNRLFFFLMVLLYYPSLCKRFIVEKHIYTSVIVVSNIKLPCK